MSKLLKLIAKNIFTGFLNNMKIVTATAPNVISVTTSSVKHTAKLPLSRIRGSSTKRANLAESYSYSLIKNLGKISNGSSCYLEDFKNILQKILEPDKISLSLKPHADSSSDSAWTKSRGSLGRSYFVTEYSRITGNVQTNYKKQKLSEYIMYLPLDETQKIIKNKYVAVHEARHLFDYICNPKTILPRNCRIADNEEKNKAFEKAYTVFLKDDCIPFMEFIIKMKAQKHLSVLSDEECIDCLQEIRNAIKTEINAYRDQLASISNDQIWDLTETLGILGYCFTHNYPKRLKIVNKMLAEKIASVREDIKANVR